MILLKAVVPAYERHGSAGETVHVQSYVTRTPTAQHRPPRVISFRSGASAPNIFRGYVVANLPVCVTLGEFGPKSATWDMVIGYAARGGQVMVDSGAFTAHTKGGTVDFDRVMNLYHELVLATPGARYHFVMPDRVGDQHGSLTLLHQYRGQIRGLIAAGQDCFVPVQKGGLPPFQAWREACGILGTDDITVSVPSNKAAFSLDDLANLMSGPVKPKRVHLLGIAGNKARLAELVAIIHSASPDTVITTDANRLRAQVGQGRIVTVERGRKANWLKDAFASLLDDPEQRALFLKQADEVLAPAVAALSIAAAENRGSRQTDLFGTAHGEVR